MCNEQKTEVKALKAKREENDEKVKNEEKERRGTVGVKGINERRKIEKKNGKIEKKSTKIKEEETLTVRKSGLIRILCL